MEVLVCCLFSKVAAYLHGTDAELRESLDPIVLRLLQNLIQFFVILWKWDWAVPQEVQNQSKMSATPIQNYPTWDSRKIVLSQLWFFKKKGKQPTKTHLSDTTDRVGYTMTTPDKVGSKSQRVRVKLLV